MEDLKKELVQMETDIKEKYKEQGVEPPAPVLDEKDYQTDQTKIKAWLGESSSSSSSDDSGEEEKDAQVNRLNDRDEGVRNKDKYDYSSGLSSDNDMDLLVE
jgi:hypothetical protein